MEMCYYTGLILITSLVGSQTSQSPELALINNLTAHYDRNALPTLHAGEPVNVTLDIAFSQLMELDPKSQVLTMSIWVRMHWKDWGLRWDPADFNNLSTLHLYAKRVWTPDIVLYNRVSNSETDDVYVIYPVVITSDGDVAWYLPRIMSSSCPLDMSFFPWDKQVCMMTFGSWSYDGGGIDLFNFSATGDTAKFQSNGEWHLVAIKVKREVTYYNCCKYPYITLSFFIHLKRKPLYYIINVILPSMFIGLTGVVSFCAPPASGEKITLSITVLLASTVFLLMVNGVMPIQSNVVPMIGRFFLILVVFLALSTVQTVLVVYVFFGGDLGVRPPGWMRKLFLHWGGRALFCQSLLKLEEARARSRHPHETSGQNNVAFYADNSTLNHAPTDNSKRSHPDNYATAHQGEFNTGRDFTNTRQGEPPNNSNNNEHLEGRRLEGTGESVIGVLKEMKSHMSHKALLEDIKREWFQVSRVLDRLFLIVFVICILANGVALFIEAADLE